MPTKMFLQRVSESISVSQSVFFNPHERLLTKEHENRVDRQFGRDGFAAGVKALSAPQRGRQGSRMRRVKDH
jgi:hypothetical protein